MTHGSRYYLPTGEQIELLRFSESVQRWVCGVVYAKTGRVYPATDSLRGKRVSMTAEQIRALRRVEAA